MRLPWGGGKPFGLTGGNITSESDGFCNFNENYSIDSTCEVMAKVLEKSIIDYAIKSGKQNSVGGNIEILKITPGNKFEWIKNPPNEKPWETLEEFERDYKEGKVNVTFLKEGYKEEFEKLLSK